MSGAIRPLSRFGGIALAVALLAGCGTSLPTTPPTGAVVPSAAGSGAASASAPGAAPPTPAATSSDAPVPAPSPIPPEIADLHEIIAELVAEDGYSGVVLVARGEQPVWAEAFGLADRADTRPNRVDTGFNIASVGKTFTAVAVMQLVEQGRLSVRDHVGDILPDFPNADVAQRVTVDQLLAHTAGLGDVFSGAFFDMAKDRFQTLSDYLPLIADESLAIEPGTEWHYSNSGYIVLGLIVERLTGLGFDDYVWEHVFRPTGMLSTAPYGTDDIVPNLAVGYTTQDAGGNDTAVLRSNRVLMPWRGTSAGGYYSTAYDLLRFRNALLGRRLLGEETTDLLFEGKVEINPGVRYAYGFFDRDIEGQRVVSHSGGMPGSCNTMDTNLDSGYTVIALSNSDTGCYPIVAYLHEHALGAAAK